MAKKTRIEDIDSEAVINSFRLDDTSIPPEARSAGGNAPSPPPKKRHKKQPFPCLSRTTKRNRNAGAGTASWKTGL